MVGDGYGDGTADLGDGGFDVAPGVAAVVGIAGEIASGVIAEASVAEADGGGAAVLGGIVFGLEGG
jgi:hypothetical protein